MRGSISSLPVEFVLITVVLLSGCSGPQEPRAQDPGQSIVGVVTPTPDEEKARRETEGYSRDSYLARTEKVRAKAATRQRKKDERTRPSDPRGLGKKIFQGLYQDIPEELANRADLLLLPVPDSEEVMLFEPAQ